MTDSVVSYRQIQAQINNLAQLIVVSKSQSAAACELILQQGHRVFGENKVQEALAKWPDLKTRYQSIELHCLGSLQTNKVRDAVALFDVIESLDRPKLAACLRDEMKRANKYPACFVQINIGNEAQKAGVAPELADRFIDLCLTEYQLPVTGLMCVPPSGLDPIPYFINMRQIQLRHNLPYLSMGMSGDYQQALQQGATHVRIGTGIFGARVY